MLHTIIYQGPPRDVEGFPKEAKRSCVGSLGLLPGTSRDVTPDEMEHLKSLGVSFRDITPKAPSALPVAPKEEAPKALEEVAAAPRALEEVVTASRPKKGEGPKGG